ncbi:MerR family transcriptional regulator [Gordonia sp. TBRC 11910]|uniref:MerR family transcriptional regulator n=1 Tax=Gordonia asplenii TaxID=2725283 RepID=A0A848KQP1_9ACTN|nr:MerR family transcriptional regulator [Gordonia asplenii]NMO01314.1 MerR family transcriptional regulator [Gordonia asplenii]
MLIGDVARRTGVSARMLRHYDRVGLVQPTGRTSGGYREYSAADIRRLFHVESLRTLGLSLADVKRALDESDFAPTELVAELIEHTKARIAAEQELLANLERVDAAAPAAWDDVLRMIGLLRALDSDSAGRRQQAVLTADDPTVLPPDELVAALLTEDDQNVAGALRWALARVPGHGIDSLATGLASPDVDIRRRAFVALEGLPGERALELLARALHDTDPDVVQRAALSLGRSGIDAAVPSLLAMVVDGERDVEAAEVLGALAESSGSEQITELVAVALADSPSRAVRLRITQALAEIPGRAAASALGELSNDADPVIAATAAGILRSHER